MRKPLNGCVVADADLWLYDFFAVPAFAPQTVRDAIEANPEGEDLIFEINSGGGSAFSGFEIYSVLRNAPCHTVAEIQSMSASAASTLMLGCSEVWASPVAQVMIHMPAIQTNGDVPAHVQSISVLNSITESILNSYVLKCGNKSTRNELRQLMATSAWMTAPEAQGIGLVDKIIGAEDADPSAILNCVGDSICHGIRALAGSMPNVQLMRKEYAQLVAEGKAPARNGILPPKPEDDTALQLAKARLDLEKIRF